MPKFKKKPVVIEAWLTADLMETARRNWESLPYWIRAEFENGNFVLTDDGIQIQTLAGTMLALPSDQLIRGVKGEFYPCEEDIFKATHEAC